MIVENYRTKADLYEIFSLFKDEPYAAFLDSSLKNQYGKYSIVALLPDICISQMDDGLYINDKKEERDFLTCLGEFLKSNKSVNDTVLPFKEALIGYLSYDYGKEMLVTSKNKLAKATNEFEVDIPKAIFVLYKLYLIQDEESKEISLIYKDEEVKNYFYKKIDEAKKARQDCQGIVNRNVERKATKISSDFSEEEYEKAISQMIDYIYEGDIYIANMTRRIRLDSYLDPFAFFSKLRKDNPAPFGAYFNYPDFQIISASPERFFEVRKGLIKTRPIKGTRPRSDDKDLDLAFKKELEESDKDKSELLMIVDLERNDLSRICKAGTVKVPELFEIETYATVFHLVSTISGKIKDEVNVADILEATFPGGSITGAPKIRAMEIIEELERSKRGLYTGSIGYISLDGDCDFNIVIRSLVHKNGEYILGTGGGITAESDTVFEYEETNQKALALLKAEREA